MQFTKEQYELLPYIAMPLANDPTLSLETGKNTNEIREMVKPMIEHGLVTMELVGTREMYELTSLGHATYGAMLGGIRGSIHKIANIAQKRGEEIHKEYENRTISDERIASTDYELPLYDNSSLIVGLYDTVTIDSTGNTNEVSFGGGDFGGAGTGSNYYTDSTSNDSSSDSSD